VANENVSKWASRVAATKHAIRALAHYINKGLDEDEEDVWIEFHTVNDKTE